MPRLRTMGVFSGIGGLERGFELAGHQTVGLCEIDEGAQAVLRKHFLDLEIQGDIRKVAKLKRGIDVLTAGFPCQDLSQVGTAKGIKGSKSGLVKHVFRLLEQRPVPWVVLENVSFMLRLDQGSGIRRITKRFERLGYKWAYRVLDSRAFGVPQRRLRVFLVASLNTDPRPVLFPDDSDWAETSYRLRDAAHGFYWTEGNRGIGWAENAIPALKGGSSLNIFSPPAIVLTDGRIVTPTIEACERMQGFPIGWTKPAIKAGASRRRGVYLGNAVTVPVAKWIGKRLGKVAEYDDSDDTPLLRDRPWPTAAWFDGKERAATKRSPWPRTPNGVGLEQFIGKRIEPLSGRAAAGFLARLDRSTLRSVDGFKEVLRRHIDATDSTERYLALRTLHNASATL